MNEVRRLAALIFGSIGSPAGQEMLDLLAKDEWAAIQSRCSNPNAHATALSYRLDTYLHETFRKLRLPGDNEARRKKAVETFWEAETQCALTNVRMKRLANLRKGLINYQDSFEIQMVDFVGHWRRELRKCLGPAPAWLEFGFSSGSTLSNKGNLTTIPDKLETPKPTFYQGLFPYRELNEGTPFADKASDAVRSNRFFTVPKDSFKDRGCCVEASLAVGYQLAVGKVLKQRYKKWYMVDLAKDSPELHRMFAKEGSISGEIATIDLSNASDTVSRELVRLLLPDEWLMILESLRAPSTDIDGKIVYLEKFTSMGNGFTFELETILFRTLIASLGYPGLVFGDDIIVETHAFKTVCAALSYFGFTPNMKKTFGEGPFRESCGGDFFKGESVRPYYMKEIPVDPIAWIGVANGLKRADPELAYLKAAWDFAVDQIPTAYRVFGPVWLEDSVIHVDDHERHRVWRTHKTTTYKKGRMLTKQDGYYYRVVSTQVRTYDLGSTWEPRIAMIAGSLGTSARVAPRNSKVLGYRLSWASSQPDRQPYSDWLPD